MKKQKVYTKVDCKDRNPDYTKDGHKYYITDLGEMWLNKKGKAWYYPGMSVCDSDEQPEWWMEEKLLYAFTPGELVAKLKEAYQAGIKRGNYEWNEEYYAPDGEEYIKNQNIEL